MEAELQELRDLVAQLRVNNEWLREEQVAAIPGPTMAPLVPSPPTIISAPLLERLVFLHI